METHMKISHKYYTLVFYFYTLGLILLSVLPLNSSGSQINHTYLVYIRIDYLLHFATLIPWVYLLRKKYKFSFRNNWKTSVALLLGGIIFAILLEAVQYIIPYRAYNINDLLANGIGVLLGSVFFIR